MVVANRQAPLATQEPELAHDFADLSLDRPSCRDDLERPTLASAHGSADIDPLRDRVTPAPADVSEPGLVARKLPGVPTLFWRCLRGPRRWLGRDTRRVSGGSAIGTGPMELIAASDLARTSVVRRRASVMNLELSRDAWWSDFRCSPRGVHRVHSRTLSHDSLSAARHSQGRAQFPATNVAYNSSAVWPLCSADAARLCCRYLRGLASFPHRSCSAARPLQGQHCTAS